MFIPCCEIIWFFTYHNSSLLHYDKQNNIKKEIWFQQVHQTYPTLTLYFFFILSAQNQRFLQGSPHFFMDAYYVHEPPSEENQCDVMYILNKFILHGFPLYHPAINVHCHIIMHGYNCAVLQEPTECVVTIHNIKNID